MFYIRIIVCLAKEASRFYYDETAAPPMISSNSLVMACWRVLLYCKVNCWIKSGKGKIRLVGYDLCRHVLEMVIQ